MLAAMPTGDAGTVWTLKMMAAIARKASHDSSVRRAAVQIIGGLPRASRGHIEAIRRYLSEYVRFTRDPEGIEYVQQPARLVAEIEINRETYGDCDDVATLGAALGMAIGLSARFVVVSFKRGAPRPPYGHVYVEMAGPDAPEDWIALDTTRPAAWVTAPTRLATYPV